MNGTIAPIFSISVFDDIVISDDLSATVSRHYTITNEFDESRTIEFARREEFEPPVSNFQCINASVKVDLLASAEGEIREAAWVLGPLLLESDESVTVEFRFKRDFVTGSRPLVGNFEYSSSERVSYSARLSSDIPHLLEICSLAVEPAPLESGKESHEKTGDGRLLIATRRLSRNKGGKFQLSLRSEPAEVPTLPVLKILGEEAAAKGISLADHVVIIIPHLMRDFLSLLDALEMIGLEPENTYIIGIPYSLKQYLIPVLFHRGYANVRAPDSYPFTEDLDFTIENAFETAESCGLKVLVIEDGGYVVPRLHEKYPEFIKLVTGAVEQTANGVWHYQPIVDSGNAQVANMSVASSELKLRLESPYIGDAVLFNVVGLLDTEAHVAIRDREILVVGYGATGSRVAAAFSANGATVTIFDTDEERKQNARIDGYAVADDLENAIREKFLVVGCTGKSSIGIDHLRNAADGTIFVNASSKRLELNHDELDAATEQKEGHGGITKYSLHDGPFIYVLADGFPINFHGNSESVPDKELQFIYGLIFASAVHVVQNAPLAPGIIEVPLEIQKYVEELHNKTRGIRL